MRTLLFTFLAAVTFAIPAIADGQSLAQGIGAVAAVQQHRRAEVAAQQAAALAAQQAAEARREAREQVQLKEQEEQAAQNRALALQRAKTRAARAADNAHYRDQVRDLQLEQMRLQLQSEKDRVSRDNDFLNAKLKRENAQTDVVQSEADANRNISTGAKVLMEKTGDAEVKKAGNTH